MFAEDEGERDFNLSGWWKKNTNHGVKYLLILLLFSFALMQKKQKIKANAIAPQALPSQRTGTPKVLKVLIVL